MTNSYWTQKNLLVRYTIARLGLADALHVKIPNTSGRKAGGRRMQDLCYGSCYLPGMHSLNEEKRQARHQWLTPVILATQEAEVRRITVLSQPGQIVCKTLSQRNPSQRKRGVGVERWNGSRCRP
jgi:hypothetical protein